MHEILLRYAVFLLLVTTAYGRPEGAPPEACAQIAPMHAGISPSIDPLPFNVDLSDFTGGEYVPGDTYQSKNTISTIVIINCSILWHQESVMMLLSIKLFFLYSNTFGRCRQS